MKTKYIKILSLTVAGIFLSTFYTNCAKMGRPGSSSMTSLQGGVCEDELLKVYADSVHPFLSDSKHCKNCHVEGGPGLGAFASSDLETSYNAFSSATLEKISVFAVNPNHNSPYTGPQNKSSIDTINTIWPKAKEDYDRCLESTTLGQEKESIRTSSKSAPNIYLNNAPKQTLTWNLDSATDLEDGTKRAIPAVATIDVQLLLVVPQGSTIPVVKGYIFSNPTLKLKSASQGFIAEGMYLYINNKIVANQTTYIAFSKFLATTQTVVLESAQANTFFDPVSVTDTFSLEYRRLVPTSDDMNDTPPFTPILAMQSPSGSATDTNSLTGNLVTILKDSGISRWCLTTNSTPVTSTEQTCPDGNGPVNGWYVTRPGTFGFQTGSTDGSKKIYLWVANTNLKINMTPATYDLNLDRVAPSPVTIAVNGVSNSTTVSITDLQVADLTVSASAGASGWCVKEIASTASFSTPNLNDRCWKWSYAGTKPTTVGFRGGGFRKVAVYARDAAGNISTISNIVNANNTLGEITYSDLINSSGGPRAVFYNNCKDCHMTAGQPGYAKLKLFIYANALDVTEANDSPDNSLIVSRTNNPLSPMPNINSGLMNIKYRDLIRLWVSPEGSSVPLE